ncbi:MAG: hypothetical protein OXR72_08835 [Gemmatimonadota bacterium]|nr:hypothetical protein [Gemmatimonadota bacterium]
MLAKILGIILIAIGAYLGIFEAIKLIGMSLEIVFLLLKLLVSFVLIYVGYRLLTGESR